MARKQLETQILDFLSKSKQPPKKPRQLARSMGIAEAEYGDFRAAVKALTKTGRVVAGAGSALLLPEPAKQMVGRFRANPRGFGFVIPESPTSHGDLYIPQGAAGNAITGDLVSATVYRRGKRQGKHILEGSITKIIERGRSQFVGALYKEGTQWYVLPDGKILHGPIKVDDVGAKRAKAGDQVVVEITEFPSEYSQARGVISKVLGKSGEPEVDTLSVIHQFQLPHEFPQAVLDEARQVVDQYDPDAVALERDDIRDVLVITIDPDDARDFDDAISIQDKGRGRVELGVHIADVSYFVRDGKALDTEAKERGTSTYFPGYVVPMLPEILSNGLCSLQEGQPRLCKSAFITYNRSGDVVGQRLAETVIHSDKRLTYLEATAALEGKTGGLSAEIVDLLEKMEKLARAIEKRRRKEGMIELSLPEVELQLDADGAVMGVQPADTSYSHKIIEMFMVEANEATARVLRRHGMPALRRIHPPPDRTTNEELRKFLRALGLTPPNLDDRVGMQALLSSVKGTPIEYAVNLAVLKTMNRAIYSPELVGHFALASEDYAHFTSPIRRYPDLTVHRMIKAYLDEQVAETDMSEEGAEFEAQMELGEHCSERERRAEDASRELRMVKLLRLLAGHVGDEFDAVVTGVTSFGVFLQISKYLVEGLCRFEDIGDDWWDVDASRGMVVGERSGMKIALGQTARVAIAGVDIPGRTLDITIVELKGRAIKPSTKKTSRGRSTKKKPDVRGKPRGPVVRAKAKKVKKATKRKTTRKKTTRKTRKKR